MRPIRSRCHSGLRSPHPPSPSKRRPPSRQTPVASRDARLSCSVLGRSSSSSPSKPTSPSASPPTVPSGTSRRPHPRSIRSFYITGESISAFILHNLHSAAQCAAVPTRLVFPAQLGSATHPSSPHLDGGCKQIKNPLAQLLPPLHPNCAFAITHRRCSIARNQLIWPGPRSHPFLDVDLTATSYVVDA